MNDRFILNIILIESECSQFMAAAIDRLLSCNSFHASKIIVETEKDLNILKDGKDGINFQKASSTLDGNN